MLTRRPRSVLRRLVVATALLALLAPATSRALSKAIWGQVDRDGVNQFPMYHQLGVSIYEIDLRWDEVAPTRPVDPADPRDPAYHWPGEIQQALTQARRFHMRVLLQIIGAPAWANGGQSWNWAPRR